MHKSLSFVRGLIDESIRQDPNLRKQQMFGGDPIKESEHNQRLEELQ